MRGLSKILVAMSLATAPISPANAASMLSLGHAPQVHRAGAELENPNKGLFDSTEGILLLLGGIGAGILAAVEWIFDSRERAFSP